jgi:hypothetical protein
MQTAWTKEHIMNRQRIIIGTLAFAGLVILPVSTANAEGGNGRSYCSESGRPAGQFAGDIFAGETLGNAGEVVSWFSRQGIQADVPWGQTVKLFCDPRPS